ncbi:hypothetical protein M3D80_007600, partial [Micrococcus luteus]|nr:hypothetical protein [Micrococcus luteus]
MLATAAGGVLRRTALGLPGAVLEEPGLGEGAFGVQHGVRADACGLATTSLGLEAGGLLRLATAPLGLLGPTAPLGLDAFGLEATAFGLGRLPTALRLRLRLEPEPLPFRERGLLAGPPLRLHAGALGGDLRLPAAPFLPLPAAGLRLGGGTCLLLGRHPTAPLGFTPTALLLLLAAAAGHPRGLGPAGLLVEAGLEG